MPNDDYVARFDRNIAALFGAAARISLTTPARAWFFLRTYFRQRRAVRVRAAWRGRGLHVPPLMIMSVTDRCNFSCSGCYARTLRPEGAEEMNADMLRRVVSEASALGTGIIMLAGGEPLLRADLPAVAASFPDILFIMFTNGSLIDAGVVADLRRRPNLVPVISLEGEEWETDARRGARVHERALGIMERLKKAGVFFGASFTVTRATLDTVTDDGFIRGFLARGASVFFFVEYVPVNEATMDWALTPEQKRFVTLSVDDFGHRYAGLFLAFPGDEEQYGGCLAAGRGFIHVNSSGGVEPCPFAPFAAADLRTSHLKEALASPFLKALGENREMLGEAQGGCALWANREWVASLASAAAAEPPPREGDA